MAIRAEVYGTVAATTRVVSSGYRAAAVEVPRIVGTDVDPIVIFGPLRSRADVPLGRARPHG